MTSPHRRRLPLLFAILLLPAIGAAASLGDNAIGRAVQESYNFRSLLNGEVHASVEDGLVLLTGTAHDRDLRTLATDTVAGCPGVRGINNRVIVSTSIVEYSDSWVALKLSNSLRMRAGIDATRIHVEVIDQVATLSGAVESREQKQLVENYAQAVNWVRSVVNDLTVDEVPRIATAPKLPMDDASISALLKYSLRYERLVTLSRAEITTHDGIVLITGHAESEAEKTLISACALSIRGVATVHNNMLAKAGDL